MRTLTEEDKMKITKMTVVSVVAGLMLWMAGSAAFAAEMGTVDTSKESIAKIQNFVDNLKKSTPVIEEIAVYATLADGNTMRIVSTTPNMAGKPADPEDIDAIIENQVIVIEESGVVDVTVPMANAKGQPAAVAGIKIALKDGMTKDSAKEKAVTVAKEIDEMLVSSK